MEAKALTPRALFDGNVHYEIPPFQRPYVWTEEDQWQPLWDDIARVADGLLDSGGEEALTHFLGAVVVKNQPSVAGDPTRSSVIDGQQRLTTLQLLLDAAQLVMEQHGHEDVAETIHELVSNQAKRFVNTPKRFKLWPSRIDRAAFEHVMDNDKDVPAVLAEARIVQAHEFFRKAITEWSGVDGNAEEAHRRLAALADVLQQRLQIVAIDLSGNDDDQLIFETLNDRGTPLLAADLIKNYVFQQCEGLGADIDTWAEQYWADFDDDWWRGQVSQGRLYRSRIDLFLQYWLTMQTKEEVPTDAVFGRFREYADSELVDRANAEKFLSGLRADADTFRGFAELERGSASGTFFSRVVEALELGAFIPLLLWIISKHHPASATQADKALNAVESWAVRRTLLRRTMKDVNKLVVALLRELDAKPSEEVGDATVAFLREQTADSRTWPTDEELLDELPRVRVYGSVKQQRLRAILSAIELHRRTARHEDVALPAKLDLEHVMPQGWRTHWDDVLGDPDAARRRDHLVNTLGNLTLVTQSLNGTLSNRPWTDSAAEAVAPTGKDRGLGKHSLLKRFSILVLNKDIVDRHLDAWTEQDIERRNVALAEAITQVWPHAA